MQSKCESTEEYLTELITLVFAQVTELHTEQPRTLQPTLLRSSLIWFDPKINLWH